MNRYIQFFSILVVVGIATWWFLREIQKESKLLKNKKK